MAIALRGSASVPTGNPTTSFTVTVDAAVAAGDLLFLAVTSRDSTGAGSLSVTDNDTGGNTWTKIGNSTDHKATLWYKRATSGTAGKTVTVSNAVGSASGVLKAFSGGDAGETPYTNVVIETNASADETHAGFIPSNDDSMVCCSVHNYANDNAVTSLSFATLGATTATEKTSTGGSDCGCIFGHKLQTGTAVATGNLTWAQTDGTTYSITWAIKPPLAYTLTASVGSFTETGNSASLLYGRQLTAATGAFTETGNNAGTLVGYKVTAAVGSFTLTGNNATLTVGAAGYTLTAAAGSFVESGQAAQLLYGRRLTSSVGAFSESGQPASLLAARILTASPGVLIQIGQPAILYLGEYSSAYRCMRYTLTLTRDGFRRF